MPDDFTLTKVERLMLINQFRILEAVCTDKNEAESYAKGREILERGYEFHYKYDVFCEGNYDDPMPERDGGEVYDTLGMFDAINKSLPEGSPLKKHPHSRFSGYDGNNEAKFMTFACFTVKRLGWFQLVPLRETDPWNSHCPMRGVYGRMLAEWKKISPEEKFCMTEDQLRGVMDASRHPDAD